jgi:hypothetical protein
LLSLLETNPCGTAGATIAAPAAGTLSRPKIAAAAAPTIRKQVRATMVIAFDKQLSSFCGASRYFPDNQAGIKA